MNTKIEFHILQSFPPANLNRDESNMPKDTVFGGVRRARISSQSLKRAIRLDEHFANATQVQPSDRTRRLKKLLNDEMQKSKPGEETEQLADAFTEKLLGSLDRKSKDRSNVLFFVSDDEVKEISSMLLESGIVEDAEKEYKKIFANRTPAPDIALFGRMLAEDPKLNLEAACQVAHAISTHKVDMEFDFFTAAETITDPEDPETGAGMMGVTGYNASCFYRYAAIDWEQLLANLGDDQELAARTVKGFMQALAFALPSGKQNAFAAVTMPYLLMAVVRKDGQAWSLANAFEKPVKSRDGYQKESLNRLTTHWQRLNQVYTMPDMEPQVFTLVLDQETTAQEAPGNKVDNLNTWISETVSQLVE